MESFASRLREVRVGSFERSRARDCSSFEEKEEAAIFKVGGNLFEKYSAIDFRTLS